jgi:hypothetical protein
MHFDFNLPGKFAAKIIDVHAGAAVHQWRIFACKQPDSHGSSFG